MKACFNSKRMLEVDTKIISKELELDSTTKILIQLIKDKASNDLIEQTIRKRNILIIDVQDLEKQLVNLKNGKNQYGSVVEERSVRQFGI